MSSQDNNKYVACDLCQKEEWKTSCDQCDKFACFKCVKRCVCSFELDICDDCEKCVIFANIFGCVHYSNVNYAIHELIIFIHF